MNAIAKQLGVSHPVDPELDPSSCGNARAAPSTRAGRERGRDGTGRALAFPSKKKNKLWIWLAFDRSGQRLVDWECGVRDAATLNRGGEKAPQERRRSVAKPWSVTLYCTDDYGPYDTLLPVGRHYIGKDEHSGALSAWSSESVCATGLHRSLRRSCGCVENKIKIVDANISNLFDAFHDPPHS